MPSINLNDCKTAADVKAAIECAPLGFMFGIMDAEAAANREAAIWEGVITEFAKCERIKTAPSSTPAIVPQSS